jgi:hypothetical protein
MYHKDVTCRWVQKIQKVSDYLFKLFDSQSSWVCLASPICFFFQLFPWKNVYYIYNNGCCCVISEIDIELDSDMMKKAHSIFVKH